MARTRKIKEVDIYEAEQIASAVGYTAHFTAGRGQRYTVECATIEEARAAAVSLNAQYGGFGRRAILYAVSPSGASFPVS